MCPPDWVYDYIPTLLRPAVLLSMAIYHFFMTILEVVFVEWRPFSLFSLTKLRHKSFARLWKHNGEAMSVEMPEPIEKILPTVSGLVLDVGPGSGEMLNRFDASKITTLYGAEPAADLHPGLLRNAEKAGFGGKYKALLCGGEPESLIPALAKSGVLQPSYSDVTRGQQKPKQDEEGVFDEIVCVRVLCGVPHPQETIRGLYGLLKPGGRLIACEHVRNPWRTQGWFLARLGQVVYTFLGWPFFMGGCELQRKTEQYLREAGEWQSIKLEYVEPDTVIPFLIGELRKK